MDPIQAPPRSPDASESSHSSRSTWSEHSSDYSDYSDCEGSTQVCEHHQAAVQRLSRQLSECLDPKKLMDLSDASKNQICLLAAAQGRLSVIRNLVNAGAQVNYQNDSQNSALHLAVLNGHRQLIKEMVALGWDVNLKDQLGRTPLFAAVEQRQFECVAALLECGANPMITDFRSWTPLHQAASLGQTGIALVLLESGVDVNALSRTGHTACDLAFVSNASVLAQMLFERGGVITESTLHEPRLSTPLNTRALRHLAAVVASNEFNKDVDLSTQFPLLIGNQTLLDAVAARREQILSELSSQHAAIVEAMGADTPVDGALSIGSLTDLHTQIAQYALDCHGQSMQNLLFPDLPTDQRPGALAAFFSRL